MKVLRHGRILRSRPPGRKAGHLCALGVERAAPAVCAALAVIGVLAGPAGCLSGSADATTATLGEAEVEAIRPSGAACSADAGASTGGACGPAEDVCAASPPGRIVLRLATRETTCALPGVSAAGACALDLPVEGRGPGYSPSFGLSPDADADLALEPDSLRPSGRPGGPQLRRGRLEAPAPEADCARPFEVGAVEDLPNGVRRIQLFRGLIAPDGTVEVDDFVGLRRDESATFDCASSFRLLEPDEADAPLPSCEDAD